MLALIPAFICGLSVHFILRCNWANYKMKLAKEAHRQLPLDQRRYDMNQRWSKSLYPGDSGYKHRDLEKGEPPQLTYDGGSGNTLSSSEPGDNNAEREDDPVPGISSLSSADLGNDDSEREDDSVPENFTLSFT